MRQKIIAIFLIAVTAISFCGCNSGQKHSDEAIKAAESAIMYAERYINGVDDVETTQDNLNAVSDELDAYLDENEDSETYTADWVVSMDLLDLSFMFITESISGGQISDIQNKVDELKTEIGR